MKVWVLLKGQGDWTTAMAVYADRDDLMARVERIAKANPQYPMERLGADSWRIGPDEDEGFFSNEPVYLRAVYVTFISDAGNTDG